MKEFVEGLGEKKVEDFGKVIHCYCKTQINFELDPKKVLHILDKRI